MISSFSIVFCLEIFHLARPPSVFCGIFLYAWHVIIASSSICLFYSMIVFTFLYLSTIPLSLIACFWLFLSLLCFQLCLASVAVMFLLHCFSCCLSVSLLFLTFSFTVCTWSLFGPLICMSAQRGESIGRFLRRMIHRSHWEFSLFPGVLFGRGHWYSARLHRAAPLATSMSLCHSNVTPHFSILDGVNDDMSRRDVYRQRSLITFAREVIRSRDLCLHLAHRCDQGGGRARKNWIEEDRLDIRKGVAKTQSVAG